MKLQKECVECSSKRTEKLLDGRADAGPLIRRVRASVEKNVGKKSPVILAKRRTELIRNRFGVRDVSREKKDSGIMVAKKIAKGLRLPKGGFERFNALVKVVVEANSMELDLPGHSAGLHELERKFAEDMKVPFGLDESREIYGRILGSKRILYLCDNAPELVFDLLLIEFIRSLGKEVTPVVRGRFAQDDATPREARMLGLGGFITTGSSATGVVYSDVTKKLRKSLDSADFIISKGMGNFEGLTETPTLIRGRTAFLFKVKCLPVSKEVGAAKGKGVAFIYRQGFS